MDPVSLTTAGDPSAIVTTALGALQGLGYEVTPGESGWVGRAEVGSKVGRVLLGGFARRMIVDYAVSQGVTEGQWQLTITPAMTGIGGGAIGISKAKKEMGSIGETVAGALRQSGQLPYG